VTGFFKKFKTKRLSLIFCLIALSLLVPGCTGPAYQGWSGFAGSDGILYFGTMDGRVLAINTSARSQELPFPSEGEWALPVKSPAAPGGMCGPIGCVPAAQPATIYSTPVVADNLVYVATYAGDNGKVMAINRSAPGYDKDGIPAWNEGEWFYPRKENKFIGAVVGSLIVVEDTLYVGSSDGKLYALDEKGNERWAPFETGDKIWTSPAVKGNAVYVSNYGRKLFVVSIADGSLLREIELPSAIASSLVISGDSVYFGTFERLLCAVAIADGSEMWKFEGSNWFWATPIVKDGVVYAGCLDHKIYAFDANTGEKLWQFVSDAPITSAPVLSDNLLVAASESGVIYILESDSGDLVRTVSIPSVSRRPFSIDDKVRAQLYAEDNMVYVHAGNRCVYAVDVQNGKKAWEFPYSDIK